MFCQYFFKRNTKNLKQSGCVLAVLSLTYQDMARLNLLIHVPSNLSEKKWSRNSTFKMLSRLNQNRKFKNTPKAFVTFSFS